MRSHGTYLEQLERTSETGRGVILGYQEPDNRKIDLDLEGLREGLKAIPSALYNATIGRAVRWFRGKLSKLETGERT